MIIAALTADGTTVISNIHFIERGYEEVVEKFQQLGADIKKFMTLRVNLQSQFN